MNGDLYHVRYQRFDTGGETYTSVAGPFDGWHPAKADRNAVFYDHPHMVRRCWIERDNPSVGLQTERYGNVMMRDRPGE